MKKISRWMPSAPTEKVTPLGWFILIVFLPLVVVAALIALLFWPIGWLTTFKLRKQMKQKEEDRASDTICSFVKEFDIRRTDTWILRAVYEELSQYLQAGGIPFPIHADDRWEEDLQIDDEDLAFDLLPDIAHRAQRSLEGTEKNPHYDRVKTVRDIVLFLQEQPRLHSVEP